MKGRPRSVERKVAAYLTQLLSDAGKIEKPLYRIPVIGRTGPDIAFDKTVKLIIDVKSRLQVPVGVLANKNEFLLIYPDKAAKTFYCFRLEYLLHVPEMERTNRTANSSKMVTDWWLHMDEWTQANEPDGISAIILHKPHMPIGHATVVISIKDWSNLCNRLQ